MVHDADGLDDATMLAFARETRLSETTFVQAAGAGGADYRNRIWMTTGELAFAGHPSLGTAVAVAAARGDDAARYVQQTPAGLQPVDVELAPGGRRATASMLQEPTVLGDRVASVGVASALGLGEDDLRTDLAPQVVSCGVPQVIALVRDPAVLDRVRVEAARLRAVLGEHGAITLYAAAWDGGVRAQARSFFAEDGGATEDPATGSAAGPLCAYLNAHAGAERLDVEQGVAMGRPSLLRCEAGERVRVSGDCVILATGALQL